MWEIHKSRFERISLIEIGAYTEALWLASTIPVSADAWIEKRSAAASYVIRVLGKNIESWVGEVDAGHPAHAQGRSASRLLGRPTR
jgi:hypothetical protein